MPRPKCLALRKVFPKLPHDFTAIRGILRFPSSSHIIAGHCQNEKAIENYLGL